MIKNIRGFTLLETLIVLAIIGLIAAMAVPVYTQYIVKGRRAEAATTLAKLAFAMEQFHLEHQTYENASLTALQFPETFARSQYRLAIERSGPEDYLIAAIPLGAQAEKDTACGTLRLDAQGKREITGTGSLSDCW